MKNTLILCTILLIGIFPAQAQQTVLKTNLAYWATGTPNAGIEVAVSKKWSMALAGGLQWWQYSDTRKLKHWLVQPEARYWFCETFNGHFVGLHLLGGQFNAGGIKLPFGIFPALEQNRYQGWAAGGGLTYGYHLLLNRRWSMEFAIGAGYLYMDYKKYRCLNCGKALKEEKKNYVGPTKAAISLIYNL